MEDTTKSLQNPFPGYFLATIEDSQLENVSFKGDDRFDRPQAGTLIKLSADDKDRTYNKDGDTYGSLIGHRVMWAKYAESDCLIYDNELQKEVVLIAIDKLRGYE